MSTSYYIWYTSSSHKKDRFFVGMTTVKCESPTCPGQHPKPSWAEVKDEATIFDDYTQAVKAKLMCMAFGYKGLQIEPIDENPKTVETPDELTVH